MNQIKIGMFLQELRNEKGITQEQLAEQLGVSNRTVSRWETGSNMPDISLLARSWFRKQSTRRQFFLQMMILKTKNNAANRNLRKQFIN